MGKSKQAKGMETPALTGTFLTQWSGGRGKLLD